jgi:hypothetical protein
MSQLLRRLSNRRQDFFFCHGFLQIKKPPGLGGFDSLGFVAPALLPVINEICGGPQAGPQSSPVLVGLG